MDVNSIDPNSLSLLSNPPWWNDIALVLVGGLCAVAGSILATLMSIWYQTRKARKMKMEETIGRQKVDACRKALRLTNNLRSILIGGTHDDLLGWMKTENSWILDNEIFLPEEFVVNWRSIRINVLSARQKDQRQSRMADGPEREKVIEEITQRDKFSRQLVDETEKEIRTDLGLKPFETRRFALRQSNENIAENRKDAGSHLEI